MLVRLSFRYLSRHPWLVALSVIGVAVGVAVVVGIDIANTSSRRAFTLSADAVAGSATHEIVGAAQQLPDSVYTRLRLTHPTIAAAPVIEGYMKVADCGRRVFQVLGIDPLADGDIRGFTGERSLDLGILLTRPSVAFSREAASACGIDAGDSVSVDVGGIRSELVVGGVIEPDDGRSTAALETIAVTDISTAQELFAMDDYLTRIDLHLWEDETEPQIVLPAGVRLQRAAARTETLSQMTRAFDVNLRALSLLALVVGMFLIYNSMTFSVVQRRSLIGRLRALGMTRGQIFALVSGEAAVVGLAGTAVGLVLGAGLATFLVELISRTINDLYFAVRVSEAGLTVQSALKGLALGTGVTILAALRPAWEATAVPVTVSLQRSSVETTAHRLAPRTALASILIATAAFVVLRSTKDSVAMSYVGLLLVIVTFVSLAPMLVLVGTRILRPLSTRLFGVVGKMATNAVGMSLSRTGVAIAALMVAVAATIGVGVMVKSFRSTVDRWLSYSLQADIYVQAPSVVLRKGDSMILPAAVDAIREAPGVSETYTVATVTVRTEFGAVDAIVIEPGPRTPNTFELKDPDPGVWSALLTEDVVIVSEPFAFRHGVDEGDAIDVFSATGLKKYRVGGIYYDYGSDTGVLLFSRTVYSRDFDDPGVTGVALYLNDGANVAGVTGDLWSRAEGIQELYIQSNRSLRERSLEIFDRTFVVTGVLRLLTIIVAFIGVLSALMALQMEKSRELAVMRANGMTPEQLRRFVTLQTGIMGLISGVLAVPLGLALAALLVFVINKRSFGWTLQFEPSPADLAVAIGLAVAAALIAGMYPAWKMSKTQPHEALRGE